jgi:dimethylhistidine N-methyltransferase
MTEFHLVDLKPKVAEFRADVIAGLSSRPKRLLPKYFYDERGSQLFDQICQVEEYYPTRTEMKILDDHADEIDEILEYPSSIIEYGSGSSSKIKKLLLRSSKIRRYVPIDISKNHLHRSALHLRQDFPKLDIMAVCADYTDPAALSQIKLKEENNKYIFFPGSTIGNLEPNEAMELLRNTGSLIGSKGKMILGIDLIKDEERLVAAYNDSQGVTAAFNLNILHRINRELACDFQPGNFEHVALFNREKSRMEMHLRSKVKQDVRIDEAVYSFEKGETIHTESSHKYDLDTFKIFVQEAGMQVQHSFTDANLDFAVLVLG